VSLSGARLHNLKNVDIAFPIGALVSVTGVSGSGKSTLVHRVLGPSIQARAPIGCDRVQLHVELSDVGLACQDAKATSGSSTVASLAGIAEPVRRRFAATPEARARKWTAKQFSTSTPGGRCEACCGRGVVTVAMDLLPDVTVGCDLCHGRRFVPEVLACLVDGRSIADVLDASAADVSHWFAGDAAIARPLSALCELGLGYLPVGQDASTLSAGELQRIRLAMLLAVPRSGPRAVLLDEPTRGLGFEDVERLIGGLRRLADAGHLVIAVEHDLDLIAASDWVVDLGPEAGDDGGQVVAQGTPRDIMMMASSHTGQALRASAAGSMSDTAGAR
jgi:excinuclease ABC subunit A